MIKGSRSSAHHQPQTSASTLLVLPREIRDLIWTELFPVEISLIIRTDTFLGPPAKVRFLRVSARDRESDIARKTFHSLSVVGGQMLEEAGGRFWAAAHFVLRVYNWAEHWPEGVARAWGHNPLDSLWRTVPKMRRITIQSTTGTIQTPRIFHRSTWTGFKRSVWHISLPSNHAGAQFFEAFAMIFTPAPTRLQAQEQWLHELLAAAGVETGFTKTIITELVLCATNCHMDMSGMHDKWSRRKLAKHQTTNGQQTGQTLRDTWEISPPSDCILCPARTPWWPARRCMCKDQEVKLTEGDVLERYGSAAHVALLNMLQMFDPQAGRELQNLGGILPEALAACRDWYSVEPGKEFD